MGRNDRRGGGVNDIVGTTRRYVGGGGGGAAETGWKCHATNDHTITGCYYANLLRQLLENIRQIRRGKLPRGVLFHQDNTPAHVHSGHGCYPELWIPTCRRPDIFS